MKIAKSSVVLILAFVFVSCSAGQSSEKTAIPNQAVIEKNKQTAVLNQVGATVRDVQSVEKLGRNMDSYRLAQDAESKRACSSVMEDNQREIADLEAKINNLPDNYKAELTSIIPDLNQCVSCAKNAMDSCVNQQNDKGNLSVTGE